MADHPSYFYICPHCHNVNLKDSMMMNFAASGAGIGSIGGGCPECHAPLDAEAVYHDCRFDLSIAEIASGAYGQALVSKVLSLQAAEKIQLAPEELSLLTQPAAAAGTIGAAPLPVVESAAPAVQPDAQVHPCKLCGRHSTRQYRFSYGRTERFRDPTNPGKQMKFDLRSEPMSMWLCDICVGKEFGKKMLLGFLFAILTIAALIAWLTSKIATPGNYFLAALATGFLAFWNLMEARLSPERRGDIFAAKIMRKEPANQTWDSSYDRNGKEI
jgi:hypothetical protein